MEIHVGSCIPIETRNSTKVKSDENRVDDDDDDDRWMLMLYIAFFIMCSEINE